MSKILVRRLFEQEEEMPNASIEKPEYDVKIVTKDIDGAEKALNDPKNYGGTFSQDKGELVIFKKIYLAQGMGFDKNTFTSVFKMNDESPEKFRDAFLEPKDKESSDTNGLTPKPKYNKLFSQHKYLLSPLPTKYMKPDVEYPNNPIWLDELYIVLKSEEGKPPGQFYVNSAANAARLDKFTGKTADTLGYEVKGNTIIFPKSLNPKQTNNEIKNKVKKVLDGKVEYRFKGAGGPRNLTKIGTSQAKLKEMIREEILKMLK
jgi:hypothetical protein